MSNFKFEPNEAGIKELLKSEEVESICMEYAGQVQSRAGEDYSAEARHYPERTGAAVYPNNAKGYYDNLNNNTLLRALG